MLVPLLVRALTTVDKLDDRDNTLGREIRHEEIFDLQELEEAPCKLVAVE